MTTIESPTGLVLPEPFNTASRGAWTSYGKRKLTLQVTEPGRFARNDFTTLYVEVVEREPFKGEPLYAYGQRTTEGGGHVRRSLTDAAHKALDRELLPPIQRYGFHQAWLDAYGLRMAREAVGAEWEQQRAEAERRWWADYETLAQMMADGMVELLPVEHDDRYHRQTVAKLAVYGHRPTAWEAIAAEARVDGEHVGYFTEEGSLLPLGHHLDATSGARPAP